MKINPRLLGWGIITLLFVLFPVFNLFFSIIPFSRVAFNGIDAYTAISVYVSLLVVLKNLRAYSDEKSHFSKFIFAVISTLAYVLALSSAGIFIPEFLKSFIYASIWVSFANWSSSFLASGDRYHQKFVVRDEQEKNMGPEKAKKSAGKTHHDKIDLYGDATVDSPLPLPRPGSKKKKRKTK